MFQTARSDEVGRRNDWCRFSIYCVIVLHVTARGNEQIGLTSIDGTKTRQLTRTGNANNRPVFSPNGRYLAFVRGNQPSVSLVVVNVQTGEETIVAHDAQSIRPVWRTTAAR